jgi:tetratricopeptide (TPR) repeat protein
MTNRPVPESAPTASDTSSIDLFADDLALARAQINSGLSLLAEGILARHIARLEVAGRGALDQLDAARSLLAEAIWRQGRPVAAGAVVDTIRTGSVERKRPIVILIEAEGRAATGQAEHAARLAEQVVAAIGADEAWKLRAGVPSRIAWPIPASFRTPARRTGEAAGGAAPHSVEPTPERMATAHARLDAARQAYASAELAEADRQLGAALRLDPRLAPDGIALLEPTLEPEPAADRLLLYGDLLRAAGREADAEAAFDRAARN